MQVEPEGAVDGGALHDNSGPVQVEADVPSVAPSARDDVAESDFSDNS